MGLSLSLFSVAVSEAVPKGNLVLLSEANVSLAYWVLLWFLGIHLLVVLPSLAGASLGASLGSMFVNNTPGKDERKYPLFPWRHLPWWIRFTVGFFRIIIRNLFRCLFTGFFLLTRRRTSTESSTLVMTIHDEEMLTITSSGSMEMAPSPRSSTMRGGPTSISPRSIPNSNHPIQTQSNHDSSKIRLLMILGGTFGILSVIVTLSVVGPLIVRPPIESDDDNVHGFATTALAVIVSWLCAVGLLISSLLNGFGSVSLPYAYLAGLFLSPVRPETLVKFGGELRSMQEAMVKKRTTLRELTVEVSGASRSTTPKSHTHFTKSTQNGFSELGDELKNRRQILQTEIDFLEDLVRETQLDIEELKYSQTVAAAARTDLGRIKSWVGIVFSIILLVRLCSAGYSIWSRGPFQINADRIAHKKINSDVVTTVVLWLTGHNYVSRELNKTLSQIVSLALTAILSFTQVRTFLRTLTIVNRRLLKFYKKCYCDQVRTSSSNSCMNGNNNSSSNNNNSSSINSAQSITSRDEEGGPVRFHSQLIAGFLGCYSLACIVLIKMMLPDKYSVAFSAAIGETDMFTLHAYVIDIVFFSSAMVSTAILGMLLGIQRQNNVRYAALSMLSGTSCGTSSSSSSSSSSSDKPYLGPDV
jgi:hypothetical protein